MIAVDVMGGDRAPQVVLEGAVKAAKNSIPIVLCGPASFIHQWLEANAQGWQDYAITIVDAPDVIAMDEEPVFAVRKKQQSSMVTAVACVAQQQCSAVLSAGNSGALMAAAVFVLGRNDGIERPAIAGFLPAKGGSVLALDLGANTECRSHHLHQFAHMGVEYLKTARALTFPRIGLLSNGHEEGKGSMLVKQAHALLREDKTLNFIGNVEPQAIFALKTDIVVCGGFVGNVLLKTMEASVDMVVERFGLQKEFAQEQSSLAYKKIGGAVLLGVRKPVIVCHGSSDSHAIECAITHAWNVSSRK